MWLVRFFCALTITRAGVNNDKSFLSLCEMITDFGALRETSGFKSVGPKSCKRNELQRIDFQLFECKFVF